MTIDARMHMCPWHMYLSESYWFTGSYLQAEHMSYCFPFFVTHPLTLVTWIPLTVFLFGVFYSYTDEYYWVWAFWCKWIWLGIPIDFFPSLSPQWKEQRALKADVYSCASGSILGSGNTTVREKCTKSVFLQDTLYLKKLEVKNN